MLIRHNIYIVFAAITIFAACTKHNVSPDIQSPGTSGAYIFFDTEVVSTKANLTEGTDLPSGEDGTFGVMGYYKSISLFTGYTNGKAEVYRSSDAGEIFKYDHLAMWRDVDPNAEVPHNFYAFHPYSLAGDANLNNGNPYISYTLPNTDSMLDILTAYEATAKKSLVELTFEHRLWALDVEIKLSQDENPYNPGTGTLDPSLTIVSAKLTLVNIPQTGRLFYTGNQLAPVDSRTTKEYVLHAETAGDTILSTDGSETYGPFLFFPTNVEFTDAATNAIAKVQYRIDLKLKNSWGVAYDFSYPSTAGTYQNFAVSSFEPGKRYKITANKGNGDDIDVTYDISAWETVDNIDHTFN